MIEAEISRTERRVILVDGFNVLHAVLLGKERELELQSRLFRCDSRPRRNSCMFASQC